MHDSEVEEALILPTSFAQQRLWFLAELEPNHPAYTIYKALHITGPLQRKALEQSLQRIIQRHETLRTTFVVVDGVPMQTIAPTLPFSLPLIDLDPMDFERAALQAIRQPFDLAQGPLFRAWLWRLAEDTHILLLTLHHIITDGWSMEVLFRELATFYQEAVTGNIQLSTSLPVLPIQYADYALWEQEWLQGEILEEHLNYWRKHLASTPALLDLPTDHPRPRVQSYNGAHTTCVLPQPLLTHIQALAQREAITPFMILLAALQALLMRYTGQDDIVVGIPFANRTQEEVTGLIGFFANTLALCINFSNNPSFHDLLQQVREITVEAYTHQELPFEKLVEALQPERNRSYNPLVQVAFSFYEAVQPSPELPGLNTRFVEGLTNTSSRFDLALLAQPPATQPQTNHTHDGLLLEWEYNTDLFETATIQRLAQHYLTFLQSAVIQPEQRVAQIPFLTQEEQRQIIEQWNETDAAYPRQMCVHLLIEEYAAKAPDAIAVTFEQEHLTYRELNRRANQLARYLSLYGVGPEVLVGLCVERSFALVIAALAILKAGGAYVPLDPTSPLDRLTFMLDDTHMPVLLTQASLHLDTSRWNTHVLYLDQPPADLWQQSSENVTNTVTAQNLAYAIYTSGSTGQPKGVPITHQSLLNLVSWHRCTFDLTPQARASHLAGLSFDASVWEMWPYLASGACLVLAPEPVRFSPTLLQTWLLAQQVSHSFVPTPLAEPLLQLPWPAHTALRWILTGGDRLLHFPPAALPFTFCNNYGPTEHTVVATSFVVAAKEQREADEREAPSIGYPIANTQAYVLDAYLQPVPIGVSGELYLGGESLSRGYLHRPYLTAERFLPDPFSSKPGARLYRTGDKVRYLPDGSLAFLGRLDSQVKIRGFRIELGEIESLLHRHPSVEEAITLAHEYESHSNEAHLVAYVVLKKGAHATSAELRNFLKDALPAYMLPTHILFLDILPLTPNGKVDRRALPTPTWEQDQTIYEAPQTPMQEGIVQIWAQVLHREQISIHDNFFTLGGHSLLATQIISRIRQTFQVDFPLHSFFETPTVAGLAHQVEQIQRTEQHQLLPPLLPRSRDMLPPLSFTQEGLWFLEQLRPGLATYNIPATFRLYGPLDVPALEQSLQHLIQRHEALRTTFAMHHEQVVQIIAPELSFTLHMHDLLHLDPTVREATALHLLQTEVRRPFDLRTGEDGSLLRVLLIRIDEQAYLLSLVMHHSIFDAWSMHIFYRELSALYQAFLTGQPSPLPACELHAADVAIWQRQWLQGTLLAAQLAYWQRQLDGAPALLTLPTNRPRPARQSFNGAMTPALALPTNLTTALRDLSQQGGTPLFMTLLTAFYVLLWRYSGQDDLVVGTPISNRNQIAMEGVIGYFLNTLALRCRLSGNPRLCDLLTQVREITLGAYAHQDIPFEQVVEALQPERALSHSPLFQILFVLQNVGEHFHLTGLHTTPLEVTTASAKFDLTLFVIEQGQHLQVSVEYNTDLFDVDTIERLIGHYQQLLSEIVKQPAQRIAMFTLLTEVEQEQLRTWNATGSSSSHIPLLHELVEQQAAQVPDTVALVYADQSCTYSMLNARANQLAHLLQDLEIGPDTPVGICLERSLELVIGVLGILKAGGVYVPLDPNYPSERLAFMLADTQAPVILTQRTLMDRLPTSNAHIVCLDTAWSTIAIQSTVNPSTSLYPDNLAYIIYTSGSTGTPKGVAMSHAALSNLFTWQQRDSALLPSARTLQFASLNFDVASQEIFSTIGFGQTLVLLSEHVRRDPSALWALIADEEIARLFLPVVVLQQLAECVIMQKHTCTLHALREIITAGEQLQITPQVVQLFETLPHAKLVNHYGPSESHVVSAALLTGTPRTWPALPPIGRPIDQLELHIVDQHGQPVPIGIPGELLIGGQGLARGYLARPDLTAARFRPHPLSSQPGARLYYTGDLAYYLPDGNIQFLGRRDTQVKLRGYRIELGEIEALLATHPNVWESVVIVREDTPSDKRLVAYIVPQHEQTTNGATADQSQPTPLSTQLRSFLQGKIPEYMLPSAFILLDALPLTPNGKVDQKALPAPEEIESQRETVYEAPHTPVEEVLAQIWAQILHKKQVGIHDNFFALGGHSLLATQAISHIRQTFQTDIPLLTLFETPTIAGLAEALLAKETISGRTTAIAMYRQQIESMSADEKQALLQKAKQTRG